MSMPNHHPSPRLVARPVPSRLAIGSVLAGVLLASGCTRTIRLDVMRPAKIDVPGVSAVAILPFEDAGDPGGAQAVRAQVIEGLRAGHRYQIVDLARGGGGTGTAEAVISGRVWWTVSRDQGNLPVVSTDVQYERRGDDQIPTSARDRVDWVPWQSLRALLKVEIRLIRTAGDREETVTTFTDSRSRVLKSLGGLPDPQTILAEFASDVVEPFVHRVSPHPDSLTVPVEGADGAAEGLMLQGDYAGAIGQLEGRLAAAQGSDRAPFLYDLALCHEALGTLDDIEQAIIYYREAALTNGEPTYCEGLARALRLRQEILTLARQEHQGREGGTP